MSTKKTVALHTLGCKLNFAESASIGKQFLDRGFQLVEFGQPADVTVINTCTVTERANRECRQLIRRAKRVCGKSYVVVTGCYAQLEPEQVASIEGVDAVLGSNEKFHLFDYLETPDQAGPLVYVSDITTSDDFGPAYSTTAAGRTRAYLKVQDGCDYNCSFCTIPLARGSSRSQPIDACVSQARELVSEGFKEIVLTGVNVGDYGKKTNQSILPLVEQLVSLDGLERLRISSIEPNLLSSDLLEIISRSAVLCNHLHIPLQSGHDEILALMKRRYTTSYYSELVHRAKELMPDCGIGADVISGFPGETEEHFEATCRFLEELPVSYLHGFTYSERPNTPAASYAKSVSPDVRYRRNRVLRMLGQKKKEEFHSSMVGKTRKVLLEGEARNGLRFGLTDNYARVGVQAEGTSENELVSVRITDVKEDYSVGIVEN